MYVEELVIDGFKSYAVRTVISGWDEQFNAITGLNGSGKSNILDAVCFVLGINNTGNLRAQNLQDLIYKRGQAGVTKASVTITFNNVDRDKSPFGFENYPKISVTRQVVLNKPTKYLINGHRAQQVQVLDLFRSVQLNINHPNFLIMQGKITKMLNMKPVEIMGLVEEAAGTKMYEWQREKAERTMKKKNLKLTTTETLLNEEVEPKLRRLQEQKRIVLEYQEVQKELEHLSRAVAAHDYVVEQESIEQHTAELADVGEHVADMKSSFEEVKKEIANLEHDLEESRKRREQDSNKSKFIRELEQEEDRMNNEVTRLTTTRGIKQESLQDLTQKLESGLQRLERMRKEVEDKKQQHQAIEKQFSESKVALEEWRAELDRKQDLLSTLSTGVSSKGSADGGYMGHLNEINKKISDTKVEIQKDRMTKGHLEEELQSSRNKVKSSVAELERIKKEIATRSRNCEVLELKMKEVGFDEGHFQELKRKEKELEHRLGELRGKLQWFKRNNPRYDFSYERPNQAFDDASVKGLAGELFEVGQENGRAATALEVSAGGKLFNVVVDNEKVGAQLLDRGRLRRRVTLIPLNKIRGKVIEQGKVSAAKRLCPDKVELALNMVKYDGEVSRAMQYIFGNRMICEDGDSAKKITFDRSIAVGSVTLEGDYYDPEGRLSGGSRRTGGVLNKFRECIEIKSEISAVERELGSVRTELNRLGRLSGQIDPLKHDLEVEKYQVESLGQKLEQGESATFLQHNADTEKKVAELAGKIEEAEKRLQKLQSDCDKIKEDMQEFNSDGAKKLRELKQEVASMAKESKAKEQALEKTRSQYQDSRVEAEQLEVDIGALDAENQKLQAQLEETKTGITSIDSEISAKRDELAEKKSKIAEEKYRIAGLVSESKEMNRVLKQKRAALDEMEKKVAHGEQQQKKLEAAVQMSRQIVDKIAKETDWVTDEKILASVTEQYPNIDSKEYHTRIDQLKSRMAVMRKKGVKADIMSQIEQHEKHEASLKSMIKQINKDKKKIEETIVKLDEYKRSELDKTYKKVSKDFGEIFQLLLPYAFCKLVPVNPADVSKGLEVKVRLGEIWKESLVELSGGQRSLVALSLIMALLQFKPAPLYILDEIDAALDLNHTQSIGHLIKTRFKGSQFMVVSLKEGMFTNANRLFKVRFQEGTSVVTSS